MSYLYDYQMFEDMGIRPLCVTVPDLKEMYKITYVICFDLILD